MLACGIVGDESREKMVEGVAKEDRKKWEANNNCFFKVYKETHCYRGNQYSVLQNILGKCGVQCRLVLL